MFTHVLLIGRNHLLTNYQRHALESLHKGEQVPLLDGTLVTAAAPVFVWAVTSADHQRTRRNPIAGHRREAAIERMSTNLGLRSLVFLLHDLPTTPRFADHILKQIQVLADNQLGLTPDNTLVATSTPTIASMFTDLGFSVWPMELDPRTQTYTHIRPWEVVEQLAACSDWRQGAWRALTAPESIDIIDRYHLGKTIRTAFSDPMVSAEGDLTMTRDYNVYARAFEEGAQRKVRQVRQWVKPGRIVDVGCAGGQVLALLGKDPGLRESDLYGIEVARPLFELCQHKKRNGAFENPNTFFFQRNILTEPLFEARSVDTTLTFSLTHELFSYASQEDLKAFFAAVYRHTAPGGVFINVDVIGPKEKSKPVLLWTDDKDGDETLDDRIKSLSTRGRLHQFAKDFRAEEGDGIRIEPARLNAEPVHRMSLADAMEFLSKKDYTDNWSSEMHERFCAFNLQAFEQMLTEAGFEIHSATHDYLNPWIAANRFDGRAKLFDLDGRPLPWPVTNAMMVAVRPYDTVGG